MKRRSAGRKPSPFSFTGQGIAVMLAAALIAVTGPAASASRMSAPSQTGSTPAAGQAISALAQDLEYDPQKIFRFVADDIRYEPYSSILRGAMGTLDARAGNSVDKSLLLGALLDASQVPYRFARGSLDASTAAKIVESLATDVAGARETAQEPLKRGLEQVAGPDTPAASATGPLAALYAEQARTLAADAGKRLDVARSRLDETVAMLDGALAGAGISLPAGDVSLPQDEIAGHTWVEMANGAEWVDLDPTLGASQPGAVLTPASETLPLLPDELRYKVQFDVLVERASGEELVTDNALTFTDFADQLAGTPVTFGHTTPSGLASLGVALSNLLGDGWTDYRPSLQVGTRAIVADQSVGFPTPGGGGGIFGEEPSPGASAGPIDGEATAEWLEVSVTPPGSQPQVARRTVFDRLPAQLRATGQLTPSAVEPVELVDLDGTGSMDFLPLLGVRKFAIATGPTSAGLVAANSNDKLGMFAFAYQGLRDAMNAEIALDAGARSFVDGPNIVSLSVDADHKAGSPTTRIGLDIWHRSHGILPLTGTAISVAQSELVAGVTDQIAERYAIERLGTAPGGLQGTLGVGDVFEAAASQGIPSVVVSAAVPDSLPYPPIATQLIKDAVASGDVVVVPAKPVTVGGSERVSWWRIDPQTGVTTDVMDDGSGPELAEEALIIDSEFGRLICFGAMAAAAAAVILEAAALLGSFGASSVYWTFEEGVGGTSCAAV